MSISKHLNEVNILDEILGNSQDVYEYLAKEEMGSEEQLEECKENKDDKCKTSDKDSNLKKEKEGQQLQKIESEGNESPEIEKHGNKIVTEEEEEEEEEKLALSQTTETTQEKEETDEGLTVDKFPIKEESEDKIDSQNIGKIDGENKIASSSEDLNLQLMEENNMSDELKECDDLQEYDTRSEVTSSSSEGDSSMNSMSSSSSDTEHESPGEPEDKGEATGKRKVKTSRECRSPVHSHSSKRSKAGRKAKSYDYITKLNYLFRDARFFVIKSNNAENVTLSKAKGVWSTPPQNEAKLNQAFRESRNVLLIYSVKESGKFAGFARLECESRRDVPPISWVLPHGLSANALGGVFKVDWVCRKELAFSKTQHLYNPWNEGKPVKIGRDGQEIEPRVAEELCRLFPMDEGIDMNPILRKSKEASRTMRLRPHSRPLHRPLTTSGRGHGHSAGGRGRRRHLDDSYDPRPKRSRGPSMYASSYFKEHRRDRSPGRYSVSRDRGYHGVHQNYSDFMRDFYPRGGPPLAPMPYPPLPPFVDSLPPPPPPRYYDGPPLPDYGNLRSSRSDKRSYDRSVEEFLRRTTERRDRDRERRYRDRR
ncbi:hypothetical protein R5R35_002955 [Gryllus longicercus]|uniref:YTH domain-containing protein n=1 Tax=Gryllus longicercus TaxID=2509291 RepID=A0AAN9V7Y6_9ORTH